MNRTIRSATTAAKPAKIRTADGWPSWTDQIRYSLGPAARPIPRQVPRNRPRGFRS